MVLHDMNMAARYADHLVALREGHVVAAGEPTAVMTSDLIRDVFGLDALVVPDPVSGTPLVLPRGRHHVSPRVPAPTPFRSPSMSSPRETSRFFRVRVARITELTPSFRRFTFVGDDLHEYGDPGFDQRIKVVFPTETLSLDAMPTGPDWWTAWRELPDEQRLPFRTYTTRAVRRADREVDVDMVAHDVLGPASAWIANARVGDEVLVFAPTVALTDVSFGVDFVPPAETGDYLLAGDETAAPAIAVILEQLPADATGTVVLEVPTPEDCAYLPRHRASPSWWRHGAAATATRTWSPPPVTPPSRSPPTVTATRSRSRHRRGNALGGPPHRQGRGCSEKGAAVRVARRRGLGHQDPAPSPGDRARVDRRAVAFMGYWRSGRAEC